MVVNAALLVLQHLLHSLELSASLFSLTMVGKQDAKLTLHLQYRRQPRRIPTRRLHTCSTLMKNDMVPNSTMHVCADDTRASMTCKIEHTILNCNDIFQLLIVLPTDIPVQTSQQSAK